MRLRTLLVVTLFAGCHVVSGLDGFAVADDDDGGAGGSAGGGGTGGSISACGDGEVDPGEECDDGNQLPDDGCSPFCRRECESGGRYFAGNGHCYWRLQGRDTWLEAVNRCASIPDAYLLTIVDAAERDFIDEVFVFGDDTQPWTAANDRDQENVFVHEGRPLEPVPTDLWYSDNPNGGIVENCVGLRFIDGGDNDLLADTGCNNQLRTICERDALMP